MLKHQHNSNVSNDKQLFSIPKSKTVHFYFHYESKKKGEEQLHLVYFTNNNEPVDIYLPILLFENEIKYIKNNFSAEKITIYEKWDVSEKNGTEALVKILNEKNG